MADPKELFAQGKFDDVIALVDANPAPSLMDIALRGEAQYALGHFAPALKDFGQVLKAQSTEMRFVLFQKARSALIRLGLPKAENEAFWRDCSDSVSERMGVIAARLKAGETKGVEAVFSGLVDEIFDDAAVGTHWKEAFGLLTRAMGGGTVEEFAPANIRRKVIVSGTGWSGSGAIFDYLREFDDVFTITGESSAFEGHGGFRGFHGACKSVESCRAHSIEFFFRNMLGYFPMRSPSCFSELRTARTNATKPRTAQAYAAGAPDVVRAVVQLIAAVEQAPEALSAKLGTLCDTIGERMIAFMAPDDRLVLLDNCIHVRQIELARYLSNTTVLCCFRDPRTNYVALKREFAGFQKTADQFVDEMRKARQAFDRSLDGAMRQALVEIGSHVETVLFERFIVSDSYRAELARMLGVSDNGRRRFTCLKPWESFRNTQLHLDYENPQEIETIATALPEYCVGFSAEMQARLSGDD